MTSNRSQLELGGEREPVLVPSGALGAFCGKLAGLRIGETFNQWGQWDPSLDCGPTAPQRRLENLAAHLTGRLGRCGLLLVGEAPGYLGCRFSGVAFRSERQLAPEQRTSLHPLGYSEPSATIVSRALDELGVDETTVRWNAVPTHPHRPGVPLSNRTPTTGEVEQGRAILVELCALLEPRQVVAVGKVAGRLLPNTPCVRHPARGGARAFRDGLRALV